MFEILVVIWARAATLGYRISVAVAVLPLDFCGRLRILRTMHLPAALHGVEASPVSNSGLRGLRTAFGQAALSGGLRLANPGLSLFFEAHFISPLFIS